MNPNNQTISTVVEDLVNFGFSKSTNFILARDARPIEWSEAKPQILRFVEKMKKFKSLTEPLVYTFPIGSMLNLLEDAKLAGHYAKVRGEFPEPEKNLKELMNLSTKHATIGIGSYFLKTRYSSDAPPITHLKFYNAIEVIDGKEHRKLILAAATTEAVENVQAKIHTPHSDSFGQNVKALIMDDTQKHQHPTTIPSIAPLNWGTNCPPWCDFKTEMEFLSKNDEHQNGEGSDNLR